MSGIDENITVAMISMNEEKAVVGIIHKIQEVLPKAEIVLVDSSSDQTAEFATQLGAKVIKQYPPKGYGPAMECALRSANREVIVTMDCDNTYPVGDVAKMAQLILEKNFDVVDASRLEKKPKAMPWINYLANVFFAKLASVLFLKRYTDLHSGMRAYRKSMIDELQFDAHGAALPVELLLKPMKLGYRVETIFINYRERIGQSTLQPLDSAWWTLKRILKIRFLVKIKC